jgi:hypothetical protein
VAINEVIKHSSDIIDQRDASLISEQKYKVSARRTHDDSSHELIEDTLTCVYIKARVADESAQLFGLLKERVNSTELGAERLK